MEPTALEKALFRTLAYFAYFRIPLTVHEAHTWLLAPSGAYTVFDVEECIKKSTWLKEHSSRSGVYISLQDCADWVREREAKYIDAQRKHAKALRMARLFMRIPGVVGVAVCNSLAWHATHAKSDIDFFIVTRPSRVWSVRFFTTLPLRLLRMRPGEAEHDPVCLSFFADENTLDFSTLRESNEDWYLAYWIASLQWIGGGQLLGEKMFLQNAWAKEMLPHAKPVRMVSSATAQGGMRMPLWIPERIARLFQERLLPKHMHAQKNVSSHVIVNNHMLKFHNDDRRAAISAFVRLHIQKAGI